ncbi:MULTISPECIES: type II toxin-antitoxin system RelE/ParE family toxin [unclassified Pseudoalteromonas]|uniref:type II toxin-antitoxin system RelE/ParE family toxin n=1 Tax=Pseudoalteromonas sp. RB2-MNA-CIBAN-0110 TaxID=3140439 RepID=UPI000405B9BE|nr:type II toxin-antitoxin system RelE/ParE family toxin [Pseudoalteromonas sp. TB13]
MVLYQVKLTESANKDLEIIYLHYLNRVNDQLANKLLAEIEEAIDVLATQPLLGHLPKELTLTDEDCLELLTKSFRLIYRIDNTQVFIMMILHQKQSVGKAAAARSLH